MRGSKPQFTPARLIARSLVHYLPANAAVAAGVAVASAVIVGSLLVGHSVRASLRGIALERLGRVEAAVSSDGTFPDSLAERLATRGFDPAVPALLLEGAARPAGSDRTVPGVSVLGVTDAFWQLGVGAPSARPDARSVVVNARLAEDLDVGPGDAVILSVPRRGAAPVETMFGRRDREDVVAGLRLEVGAVIEPRGIGRFGLRADQHVPRNLYVSLPWLQERLGREGMANTVLVAGRSGDPGALASVLTPEDLGLRLVPGEDAYVALQSTRLVLPEPVVRAAQKAADRLELRSWPSSVYLADRLDLLDDTGAVTSSVPYSVVMGLQPGSLAGLLTPDTTTSPLTFGPTGILLSKWAADDLGARVGDTIRMAYFASDADGNLTEETRPFTVSGIVGMNGLVADRTLVPTFEGLTDATTMADWDPPFPFDAQRIRPQDEQYWEDHGPAPKAFVVMEAVRQMWLQAQPAGRGNAWQTSFTVDVPPGHTVASVQQELADELVAQLVADGHALTVRPVRQEALAAATGSSDFGVLFMSMSGFLVIAGAVLIALLCRLSIERRASQFGLMMATGLGPAASARILLAEGAVVAVVGAVAGAPLGVGYASFIVRMLRTRWADAVGQLDLTMHVDGASVAIGVLSGLVVSLLAMLWAARLLKRGRPLTLLAGWQSRGIEPRPKARRTAVTVGAWAIVAGALAIVVALASDAVSDVASSLSVAASLGGGGALLVGALALAMALIMPTARLTTSKRLSLGVLSWRGASLNPVRSFLTVALLACAGFVIVVVGANHRELGGLDTRNPRARAGGYDLMASSALPIHHDLTTESGREALGFDADASVLLGRCEIIPMRVRSGDDASCLNMQRPQSPTVLGVPVLVRSKVGMLVAAGAAESPYGEAWPALTAPPAAGTGVPAIADAQSARWILKAGIGDTIAVAGRDGTDTELVLVDLIEPGIFAGELLINEEQFRRLFGAESGYRRFLIRTPVGQQGSVRRALVKELGGLGLTVERTADVLAGYARVQNTYLATFQTLGGLGLLLGTFGVVAVLLRAVVERRRELAVLQAVGLPRGRIVAMMALENTLLLVLGVAIGTAAALVAVAPHLASAEADVDWWRLAGTLSVCILLGAASCSVAAALALRRDLLPALRSE